MKGVRVVLLACMTKIASWKAGRRSLRMKHLCIERNITSNLHGSWVASSMGACPQSTIKEYFSSTQLFSHGMDVWPSLL